MSAFQFVICGAAASLLLMTPVAVAEAPLADAMEKRDAAAVRVLFERGADVNAKQADGMTALHWAAQQDDLNAVRLLIVKGADVQIANRYGVKPLTIACTNGNGAIVEALLDAGADPNSERAGGETALMTASRTGRIGVVKALLARGANVNAREHKQQTALMWAAADGHVEVVDALIQAGADFRASLSSGISPLFFAVREGRIEVVHRLIQAGADVNELMRPKRSNGQPTTPLILAVENAHFELAESLLKAGANPNDKPAGFTALHAITWVRKPLRGDGNPPPIGSGQLNSLEMVRRLVENGANINVQLKNGKPELGRFTTTGSTPLWLASRASDVPLMKLLVDLGADPDMANSHNCTPLLAAAGVGALGDGDESAGTIEESIEAVRTLLELDADVNAVDDNGETVMHGAAYQSRAELVSVLAEQGAEIKIWNRKNSSGWTPLMIAQGHRPANFRPAPDTIAAIERLLNSR